MIERNGQITSPTAAAVALRPLVLHADDLGLCHAFNVGIRDAALNGLLTSTSIRVNGTAFEEAIREVVPACLSHGMGVHLNIVEGRTTRRRVPRSSLLYNPDGSYRCSFTRLLYLARNRKLLTEIEEDFRDQIDLAMARLGLLDHLNSHQHSHLIPPIFESVCKLACEYGIPYVRLVREKFYVSHRVARHLRSWYLINLTKVAVLNPLARIDARIAPRYGIKTNEWFVGLAYTGHMDTLTVLGGLKAVPDQRGVTEVLLHPCRSVPDQPNLYLNAEVRDYVRDAARLRELDTLLDNSLAQALSSSHWQLTNYALLAREEREEKRGALLQCGHAGMISEPRRQRSSRSEER
jgi:chitin disaccharide deacetylase